MKNSKSFWFGIKNFDHGHIHHLSNIQQKTNIPNLLIVFRETISRDSKPFIEGIIQLPIDVSPRFAKSLLKAQCVRECNNPARAIARMKQRAHMEVEILDSQVEVEDGVNVGNIILTGAEWMLISLSKLTNFGANLLHKLKD